MQLNLGAPRTYQATCTWTTDLQITDKLIYAMFLLHVILERSRVSLFWQICKLIGYLGLPQVKKSQGICNLVSRWVNSKFLFQVRETLGKYIVKLLQVLIQIVAVYISTILTIYMDGNEHCFLRKKLKQI